MNMINKIMTYPAIELNSVSIVFGANPQRALPQMDAGQSREQIQATSGQILGVHDCSLQVQRGEIVVLMGLSGSGKSTLLRAVNGLNRVVRGSVKVDDGEQLVDISCSHAELRRRAIKGDGGTKNVAAGAAKAINRTAADAKTLRFFRTHRIAMVFQQFGLLPWRSVADNIALGLEIAGVEAKKRRDLVAQQLAMVKLAGWGDCRVNELSGGMQQRVGLARAFATAAPILLMDEPFSALDPLIRVRLQDELLGLQKNLRRTILFVSHDLDEALKIGNRIVMMDGGRIVQIGTPQQITTQPANDYVAEFVAHMNPLKTLIASSIMRAETTPPPGKHATIDAAMSLREVLRLKTTSDASIIQVQKNKKCIGIIEDADIYRALLQGK